MSQVSKNSGSAIFPSSARRGGCASNKKQRSHRSGADGVVRPARRRFRRADHPGRTISERELLLMVRPPLLAEEGNIAQPHVLRWSEAKLARLLERIVR